jgi:hypothetical protein
MNSVWWNDEIKKILDEHDEFNRRLEAVVNAPAAKPRRRPLTFIGRVLYSIGLGRPVCPSI